MTDRVERIELGEATVGGMPVTPATAPTDTTSRWTFDEHGNVVDGPPPARGFGEPRRDRPERVQPDADSRS